MIIGGGMSGSLPSCGLGENDTLSCSRIGLRSCQLDLLDHGDLAATCLTNERTFVQSVAPIEESVERTVRAVGQELLGSDPYFAPEICLWNVPFRPANREEQIAFPTCFATDERLSQAFDLLSKSNTFPTEGRVGYHTPKEMVTGQPYLLELAVSPAFESEQDAADERIEAAMGPGTIDPDEGPIDLAFTSTDVSELMAADLIGSGFDILPVTDEEQLVLFNEATVWQWQVTPTTPGAKLLNFSLSQVLEENGNSRRRSVKRLPVVVKAVSIESLLTAERSAPNPQIPPMPSTLSAPTLSTTLAEGPKCRDSSEGSDNRRALLVSNEAYSGSISVLSETHNDGARLFNSLTTSGFKVRHCRDLTRDETIAELRSLGSSLKPLTDQGEDTLAFFYYSGHGVNLNGDNYILPIDLDGVSTAKVEDGGVAFHDIFNRISSQVSRASIVVFDACRTVMEEDSRGLVRAYSPVNWALGSLQAFAAGPGEMAPDSGLYSRVLSDQIINYAAPAGEVFRSVQERVFSQSGQTQRPLYRDGTVGRAIYFKSP